MLIIETEKTRVCVGSLGELEFEGKYAYVGSNQSGGRIERHIRKTKTKKWHIDYLTEVSKVKGVVTMPLEKKYEELLARKLSENFEVVRKFGSSDCSDKGHLFQFSLMLVDAVKKFAVNTGTVATLWSF